MFVLITLVLAACTSPDAHPTNLVGTWVAEPQLGPENRSTDTLWLYVDGRAELSIRGYEADTLRSSTHELATWHVESRGDSLHLCLQSPEHRQVKTCGPLGDVTGDRMMWGFEYRRVDHE